MKKYDIFISYSHDDRKCAELLYKRFLVKGVSAFFDRQDIQAGQEYATVISSTIENCRVVLYLRSQSSEQSRWVQNELRYALELAKQVIVINIGEVSNNSSCRTFLALSKYPNYNLTELNSEGVDKLVEQIISNLFSNFSQSYLKTEGVKGSNSEHNEKYVNEHMVNSTSSAINESHCKTANKKSTHFQGCLKKIVWIFVFLLIALVGLFFYVGSFYSASPPTNDRYMYDDSIVCDSIIYDSSVSVLEDEITYPNDDLNSIVCDSIIYDSSISVLEDEIIYPNDDLDCIPPSSSPQYNYDLYFGGLIFLLSLLGILLYRRVNKKYNVKIHNRSVKDKLILLVDGNLESIINPLAVVCVRRKKGEYVLTFQMNDDKNRIENIHYKFDKQHDNQIIPIGFNQANNTDFITYRCFIGGSTSIVNERNAARAVLSILYNQYEKYNFYITAHTFEDFKNKHKIEGHQYEYDEFIRKKANCAIFIICKYVGQKTLDEYKVAIDTFESTNEERPTIFVYNDNSESCLRQDESITEFRKFVDSKKAYWRDYKDIETLMLKMKEDISAELADVLEMRPNLKRIRK